NAGPEESESVTLGLVYSPSYVEGLDISLDWWNIEITNALSTPTTAEILDQCYNLGAQAFCDLIVRDTAPGPNQGVITDMLLVPQNVASLEVEGWDFNVRYRLPETAYGQFGLNFDSSYISKWNEESLPGAPI